jgi:hypothetical protein
LESVQVALVPAAAHAPPQPAKLLLARVAAVRVTVLPARKSAEHVPVSFGVVTVQLMPLGALVTSPVPSPPPDTTDTAWRSGVYVTVGLFEPVAMKVHVAPVCPAHAPP